MTEAAAGVVLVGVDSAGGFQAMRTFQITTGLPLLVLTIATCVAIQTVLRHEHTRIVGDRAGAGDAAR